MKFILSTSGGGGHLFPALKVAEELRSRGHEIFFLGGFALGVEEIRKRRFAFKVLSVQGLKGGIKERLSFIFSLIRSTIQSLGVVRTFKPDAVLGFGGYGAVPVVLAASMLRYPTLIHEQNVIPGRANKFLAGFVNRIAISFAQSKKSFDAQKIVLTGCPCNISGQGYEKEKILKEFGLSENKITILVLGGSQGSHRINQEFIETLRSFKGRDDLQVIHACGKSDYLKIKEEYQKVGIPYALFEFLSKIEQSYSISDLIIGRAGAASVTEIALARIPSILIPYPYAQGHQKENALVLVEAGVAVMIEEKDLTATKLKDVIVKMLDHRMSKEEMDKRLQSVCFIDAAKRVAQQAIALVPS